MRKFLRRVFDSPSTWPITTYFLVAMTTLYAVAKHWIVPSTGFAILAFAALLLVLLAFRKDLKVVHALVNSQHDDLVDRVQQLTDALLSSGTEVPKPPAKGSVT